MTLKIDHVTIAAADLARLELGFGRLGLAADYGGPHSNGVTHMALLGLDDGSYIELISTLAPGTSSPWWDAHISGNGGPCAWAVAVQNIAAEAARIAGLGIRVNGPAHYTRQRPDGVLIEWELAFVGDGEPGATLPFLIQDTTPREWRVRPSGSVAGSELTGVEMVVLGVANMEGGIELFRRVYGWPAPSVEENAGWGARLARFSGTPVVLAAPLGKRGWLSERLSRFGPSPCAYLIGTADMAASVGRLPLGRPTGWFGSQVAWFESMGMESVRLGVTPEGRQGDRVTR